MQIFRSLAFLLLLFVGSTGFASSAQEKEQRKISCLSDIYEVSQDTETLFSSTLSTSLVLTGPFSPAYREAFYWSSMHLENAQTEYFEFSRAITGALSVTKIIFPFHTFL